ncbi:MAG: hypothetical protein HQL39_20715, partial [Alphaproteobacteria bacterium]|nr:hypothetical protein [Alphaproteobacteria bacterium]
GDEAVFVDPAGGRVRIGQAVVDHMLAAARRLDGREAYFPFLPELVTAPAEIWVGFGASTATDRVALRRRYVTFLALDKNRTIALVADLDGNLWSGLTFYRGEVAALKNLRTGFRLYAAE